MKTRHIDALMCALLLFIASTMSPYPAKPGSSFTFKLIWRRLLRIRRSWAIQLIGTIGCLLAGAGSIFAQGSLTPPGAPSATMKTLQQVEPRIDLQNAPASAVTTTDPNYDFIINQAGSYYLTANIATAKTNAIEINTADVTLDLNGFKISRASGSGGNGIEIPVTAHGAHVHNGSINGFSAGVQCDLVSNDRAHGCLFKDLSVSGCTTYGILGGKGAVLESCRAHDNTGTSALQASFGSMFNNCTVYNNTTAYGIYGSAGISLSNCTAANNTTSSAFFVGGASVLNNCSAYANTTGTGIYADPGCTFNNCNSSENTSSDPNSYGFFAGQCTMVGCIARSNRNTSAAPGTEAGVGIAVSYSTVKNCTAASNYGTGIQKRVSAAISAIARRPLMARARMARELSPIFDVSCDIASRATIKKAASSC